MASKKKVFLRYAAFLLILVVLSLFAGEFALRFTGYDPWHPVSSMRVDPGGKLYQPHPTLGYSHIPGNFTVSLRREYSFKITNLPSTHRITRPIGTYGKNTEKKKIWIFGCSFTYGWSLSDEQSYPWLIQEGLPEFEVVNFGANGYGTVQSLIQFREALKNQGQPEIVILAYTNLHDERNTFTRNRQKVMVRYNRLGQLIQPYARFASDGTLNFSISSVGFAELPLMRMSALAHFAESLYDRYEANRYNSHEVSKSLIEMMAALAKSHGVKFVVAALDGPASLGFADQQAIPVVDAFVDLNLPENNNLPYDPHPSAVASRKYADSLLKFLRPLTRKQ